MKQYKFLYVATLIIAYFICNSEQITGEWFSFTGGISFDTVNNTVFFAGKSLIFKASYDANYNLKFITSFGITASGNKAPSDIYVNNSNGNVIVLHSAFSLIQVYDNNGVPLFQFESPSSASNTFSPFKMAVDESTNLIYITDLLNSRVVIYNSNGVFQNSFGTFINGETPGDLTFPTGIALYKNYLFISSNTGAGATPFQAFTTAGEFVTTIGSESCCAILKGFDLPSAIAIDSNTGIAYVYNFDSTIGPYVLAYNVSAISNNVSSGDMVYYTSFPLNLLPISTGNNFYSAAVISPDGLLWVSNGEEAEAIVVVAANGALIRNITAPIDFLAYPTKPFMDNNKNIYFPCSNRDSQKFDIHKFDPTGTSLLLIIYDVSATSVPGQNIPIGGVLNINENIYTISFGAYGQAVIVFNTAGSFLRLITNPLFHSITSLTIINDTYFCILDTYTPAIFIYYYDTSIQNETYIGQFNDSRWSSSYPKAFTFSIDTQELYVADGNVGQAMMFIYTFPLLQQDSRLVDINPDTPFGYWPRDITVDKFGNIFILVVVGNILDSKLLIYSNNGTLIQNQTYGISDIFVPLYLSLTANEEVYFIDQKNGGISYISVSTLISIPQSNSTILHSNSHPIFYNKPDSTIPIIVGSVVGGTSGIAITSGLVFFACILKRRKAKKRIEDSVLLTSTVTNTDPVKQTIITNYSLQSDK